MNAGIEPGAQLCLRKRPYVAKLVIIDTDEEDANNVISNADNNDNDLQSSVSGLTVRLIIFSSSLTEGLCGIFFSNSNFLHRQLF